MKIEYKIVEHDVYHRENNIGQKDEIIEDILNAYGSNRWEAISIDEEVISRTKSKIKVYLKRGVQADIDNQKDDISSFDIFLFMNSLKMEPVGISIVHDYERHNSLK